MPILTMENMQNFHKLIAPKLIDDQHGICTFAKEIITLQMFSNPMVGEKFHVMLVGEPSSGKSELLFDVSNIVPESMFSSSRITKAGIEEALTHCNGGLFCLDEMDKLKQETRLGLLEAMQTQTVSIHKYQYHASLDAKTNVLSALNPRGDIFQRGVPLLNQIKFSIKEMTRFHFVMKFIAIDESMYGDIAMRMNAFDKYNEGDRYRKMMQMIIEARTNVPYVNMSDNLSRKIGDMVGTLKRMSPVKEMISPRLIEGARSMLKARARMNMRDKVIEEDFSYVFGVLERLYLERDGL